ncbi:MAG: AgmX/PglI C-terminal domain-containing protein [Myxococcota bacterium]
MGDAHVYAEDPLTFLSRADAESTLGEDRSRGRLLEVAAIWGDVLLDVRHYTADHPAITIGQVSGHRWRILGAPVAWIPKNLSLFADIAAPLIGEVREERRSDFYAPGDRLDAVEHHLFVREDGELRLCFRDGWTGFVDTPEERISFEALLDRGLAREEGGDRYSVPLSSSDRSVVQVGEIVFFSRTVHASRKIAASPLDRIDYPFMGVLAVMGAMFAMMSVLIATAPGPAPAEVIEIPEYLAEIVLHPEVEEEIPVPSPAKEKAAEPEGAKAKADAGKVGKRDASLEQAKGGKLAIDKQQLDQEVAKNAGILAAMANADGMAGVFGESALDSAMVGNIGGLLGAKGAQIGTGGLSSRGDRIGGGGTLDTVGGLGTRGIGGGNDDYGQDGGTMGPKKDGSIQHIGDPLVLGSLRPEQIDRVVKSHFNQIRYCYQRELNRQPDLGGKITVKFVISNEGSVSKAVIKQSSLNNAAVERCVTGRFYKMNFPKPSGNGIVIVSYPFLFSGS